MKKEAQRLKRPLTEDEKRRLGPLLRAIYTAIGERSFTSRELIEYAKIEVNQRVDKDKTL